MFRRGEEERQDPGAIQPGEIRPVRSREAASGGGDVTVIGKGARIEGNLISAGSLRIDGQVKGKITAEGDVTLSPQSQVEADIHATNVTVGGAFRGNIVVTNRMELTRGGRVDGNVTARTLVVAEGAVFCGQSIMDSGASEPPRREPRQAATDSSLAGSSEGSSVPARAAERAPAG